MLNIGNNFRYYVFPNKTIKIFLLWSLSSVVLTSAVFKGEILWASDKHQAIANTPSQNQRVLLVSHSSVSKNKLTRREVRAIFSMRLTHWPNGNPVSVFVLQDNNPLHIKFCKNILNIFPHQLRLVWNKLSFSGTGTAPIELISEQEMLEAIRSTPGAIGYLKEVNDNASLQILEYY